MSDGRDGLHVRRARARELLGVSEQQFKRVVRHGGLKPRYVNGRGRAFWSVKEINQLRKDLGDA